jgi:hypothetical protein
MVMIKLSVAIVRKSEKNKDKYYQQQDALTCYARTQSGI